MTLFEAMQTKGGIFILIQFILLVLILIITIQKAILYYGSKDPEKMPFHRSHHAILFLGVFGIVWGMFTQLVGLVQALNAIIEAADISPALILMGLRNSFVNPLIGFCTLLLAALFWAILQGKYSASAKAKD